VTLALRACSVLKCSCHAHDNDIVFEGYMSTYMGYSNRGSSLQGLSKPSTERPQHIGPFGEIRSGLCVF
jgi:hypothetical protein